jgi:hypothetical protein
LARYHLADLKNTTLKTLLEVVPHVLVSSHNKAEGVIKFVNGSEIIYTGLAEEENVTKVKSMNLAGYAFDEASEIPHTAFLFTEGAVRQVLPDGTRPRYVRLFGTNPSECWLKDFFLLGKESRFTYNNPKTNKPESVVVIEGDNTVYVQSRPKDNPFLQDDFESGLRKIYPEDWIKVYLEGSWDEVTDAQIVIQPQYVRMAIEREMAISNESVVGVDVAYSPKGDETVIAIGKGNMLVELDARVGQTITETAGKVVSIAQKHGVKYVGVEQDGLGVGVCHMLGEMRQKYTGLMVGGNGTDFGMEHYADLKTEMWFHARGLFIDGNVSIPNDPKLIRQLSSVQYIRTSKGKLRIEPKIETKNRLGSSPDRADALIIMLWMARHIRGHQMDYIRKQNTLRFPREKTNGYGWDYHENFPRELARVSYA